MKRRQFLQNLGLGAAALTAMPVFSKTNTQTIARKANVTPRGSARNLILINLDGGASHVDTFDLKLGSWTPSDFEPVTVGNGFQMAAGLFPNLVQQADKFSLLRCLNGNEAVHSRASYIVQTAQTFNPVFSREQPHIGSIIALELEQQRSASDILPPFLAANGNVQGPGLLASTYAAFPYNAENGILGLSHPDGQSLFSKRFESLNRLDGSRTALSEKGAAISDFHNFYRLGEAMMYEPSVTEAFAISDVDMTRYGQNAFGLACVNAVNVLAQNKGTRVIQLNAGGWDHHYDIYSLNEPNNIYMQTQTLDRALAAMLEDLANTPGVQGQTLLDDTLVVCYGEFGRTPGALTGNAGRDHYPYVNSALIAGGGTLPGQAFGETDPEGWAILDQLWSENRYITTFDMVATIYSALGIDWSKEIRDTPSGRVYEYTPKVDGVAGYYREISDIFA